MAEHYYSQSLGDKIKFADRQNLPEQAAAGGRGVREPDRGGGGAAGGAEARHRLRGNLQKRVHPAQVSRRPRTGGVNAISWQAAVRAGGGHVV